MQLNRINSRNVFCSKQSPPDLAQSTFSSLCAKNDGSFDSTPNFSSFFFFTLQSEAQTKHVTNTLLLLFGSYLPKLQEVSRPLSIGLMAPNDWLWCCQYSKAHPASRRCAVQARILRSTYRRNCPKQESVRRPDCLLPLARPAAREPEEDDGKTTPPTCLPADGESRHDGRADPNAGRARHIFVC